MQNMAKVDFQRLGKQAQKAVETAEWDRES